MNIQKVEYLHVRTQGRPRCGTILQKTGKEKVPVDSNTQSVEHIHTSLPKTA